MCQLIQRKATVNPDDRLRCPIPPPLFFFFAGKTGERHKLTDVVRTVLKISQVLLGYGESQDKRLLIGTRTRGQSVRRRVNTREDYSVRLQSPELVDFLVAWPWGGYCLSLSGHWFPTLLSVTRLHAVCDTLALWPHGLALAPAADPAVTSPHPGAWGSVFCSCCQSA